MYIIKELKKIAALLLEINGVTVSNIVKDPECAAYHGYNFQAGSLNIKYRKAKTTPKKSGYFVTLWRRNDQQQTEPFTVGDDFNFYFIGIQEKDRWGTFIFPRYVLAEHQILSTGNKQGKRGFRVYPTWSAAENKLAAKTQCWQLDYFVDLTGRNKKSMSEVKELLKKESPPGDR